MNKQEIQQGKAKLQAMIDERAQLEFNYRSAKAEMRDYGDYGQCSQRVIDEAAHAGYMLELWDEENQEELKQLEAKFRKYFNVKLEQKW